MYELRRYLPRILVSIGIMVTCTLLSSNVLAVGQRLNAVYIVQGGGGISVDSAVFAIILACTPPFAFCYLFSEMLNDDFAKAGIFVFTRTQSRARWLGVRLTQLCLIVAAYYIVSYWVSVMLLLAGDTADAWQQSIELFLPLLLLNVLMTCTLLIPINVWAVRFNPLFSFLAVMTLHLVSIFVCSAGISSVSHAFSPLPYILPSAQGVFSWHETTFSQSFGHDGMLAGFSLEYSYVYLFILIILELLCSVRYIQKIDLL